MVTCLWKTLYNHVVFVFPSVMVNYFTFVRICLSVEDHIGYDLPWALKHLTRFELYGGTVAHDTHHKKNQTKFAPFFRHWDSFEPLAVVSILSNRAKHL
ncbi:UNVERIFIED_CONTAM: hypothetical protein FKN15_054728 [Acipenser sinensis]